VVIKRPAIEAAPIDAAQPTLKVRVTTVLLPDPATKDGYRFNMEPSAWLVLATLVTGQLVTFAWPAPDIAVCERARTVIEQPAHDETFCTLKKPRADYYGPPLPAATS
jgi:hypothetical protein